MTERIESTASGDYSEVDVFVNVSSTNARTLEGAQTTETLQRHGG